MNATRTTSLPIHEQVAQRYGQIARSGSSCCGGGTSPATHAQRIGYTTEQIAQLPDGANLGLGCGNPTSLTLIEPGMTVLDLGSGAGIDCFLASPKVGPEGRVIGVDMTDDMLARARAFAAKKNYANVEFRKGRIEDLPVEDASVDLVISNCVINLSPDKARVYREIARVLKPGGKAAISDIVLLRPLPGAIRQSVEAYVGCIGGAELIDEYLGHVRAAGLSIHRADRPAYDVKAMLSCTPDTSQVMDQLPADFDVNAAVASLSLVAHKPA